MSKLQELLEELKGLKNTYIYLNVDGEITQGTRSKIDWDNVEALITKYTETTPTYKPGDSVRVINCTHGHDFAILEKVTLIEQQKEDQMWLANNGRREWYLTEEEFEPIN